MPFFVPVYGVVLAPSAEWIDTVCLGGVLDWLPVEACVLSGSDLTNPDAGIGVLKTMFNRHTVEPCDGIMLEDGSKWEILYQFKPQSAMFNVHDVFREECVKLIGPATTMVYCVKRLDDSLVGFAIWK